MRGKGKAVDRSGLRPVRSKAAYKVAVAEIDRLWDAKPGTPEHDRLEVLGILVDAYEAERWPIDPPDPIEAVKFHMEQTGRTQADLARLLGSPSRASEVLRRRRRMTIEMAWQLHREWGIPADSLLQPYKLAA
jgi:HTH-type transcriptional regulator / antitoxin HigA